MTHIQNPIIFTAFANPANDLENLINEQNGIQDALNSLVAQGQLQNHLNYTNTDKEAYFNYLRTWQNRITIFHFGGHAGADGIHLQNEYVSFVPLARELVERNRESLRLVFLNGCSTKAHVQTLFDLGVQTVIATSVDVQDDLAYKFAVRFYNNIAGGDNINAAYNSAYNFVDDHQPQHRRRFRFGGDPKNWAEALPNIQASEPIDTFPWGLYTSNDTSLTYSIFSADRHQSPPENRDNDEALNDLENIKKILEKNLGRALKELQEFILSQNISEDYQDTATLQKASFRNLENQKIRMVIHDNDYNLQKRQIQAATLGLIRQIKEGLTDL